MGGGFNGFIQIESRSSFKLMIFYTLLQLNPERFRQIQGKTTTF